MPALTESEARARAALLTVDSYDVSIDLTVTPVLSRTVIRFRCARPGAASFADLTARVRGGGAVLNGVPLGPLADVRLPLGGRASEDLLTVAAALPDRRPRPLLLLRPARPARPAVALGAGSGRLEMRRQRRGRGAARVHGRGHLAIRADTAEA